MQCYAICITPLVTSRPPSPRAPPPSSPASKRTGKSLGVPVSQSVSPCVRRRQLSVSLPTCAERGCTQGARPSVGFIIRSEATPGLQNTIFLNFFLYLLLFFFLSPDFWAWETTCNHVSGSRGCEQAYWKYIQGEWNHTANKEINDQYLIGSLLSLICD